MQEYTRRAWDSRYSHHAAARLRWAQVKPRAAHHQPAAFREMKQQREDGIKLRYLLRWEMRAG